MHEAAIAEAILKTALQALPRPDMKVTKISVQAGALSGIEEDSLAMWLEHAARGTACAGAKLDFRSVDAVLRCKACDYRADYDGSGPLEPTCPRCGKGVRLEAPDGLTLENIEVEEP